MASRSKTIGLKGTLFGIVLHGCKNAIVRNNKIANRSDLWLNDRGNGIHIWNNTGSLIEGNSVTAGRDGIYIEISHGNMISGNRFEGLRFAIHYMYANDNEVSGNVSIRNRVGFALMYSKNIKVIGNVSVSDLQHGLMLHTTHKSEARDNFIYGTGEKCLFIYTSAGNTIHGNRFEQCGVGVHFTGGSENNKFFGNTFIANEMQVKYTGLKTYEWSENGPRQLLERQSRLRSRWQWHRGCGLPAQHARRLGALSIPARQAPRLEPRAADIALRSGAAADPLSGRRDRQLPADDRAAATQFRCRKASISSPAPRDPAQAGSDSRPIM